MYWENTIILATNHNYTRTIYAFEIYKMFTILPFNNTTYNINLYVETLKLLPNSIITKITE